MSEMDPIIPKTEYLPTTKARDRLSEIITFVQDPRNCCVLTRHGRKVAAIVSMAEVERIWRLQDMDDTIKMIEQGKRPGFFTTGHQGYLKTNSEAAEEIQQMQMDRRAEREVLSQAGLKTIKGGELMVEIPVEPEVEDEVVSKKRRWWGW